MCSLPLVSGSCGAVVHKCARVSVSVVHGVHGVQNVVGPDGGFQRVFCEVCAHLQNVSDSVAELDAPRNPFDDSDELCADQEKQLRKGFQPGEQKRALAPRSGSFSVRREKWRLFRGRPGPSGGGFGDLAKSGAPAAILINAYSGDFCHPVLSNALAQEPLVYHSGTRELFSDIFGNTSKTDGTESDNFDFFEIFEILTILTKTVKNCSQLCKNINSCSRMFTKRFSQTRISAKTFLHVRDFSAKHKCANLQMCKCAKMCRAQNAQICSANIFPNAEITNLQMHKSALCKFF